MLAYRADIDGLRAIAVLAVVVFHAFPQALPGGFTGVDVFFVISGYLITSDIRQRMSDGTFTLLDFYARRVRRIFPALIVVLATVLAAGSLILFTDEFEQLLRHIVASTLFVQNFQLFSESGYFDSASATKPLLHLWSLAIEEQFYLLWPLAMMWRAALIARVVIVGSLLALMLWTDPVGAYYLPLTRAWQIMVGAALAMTVVRSPRVGALGLAAIVLASVAGVPFVPSAILATAGAAAVIAGGAPWLGALAPIGRISYPLYLWHWPTLAFLRIVDPNPSTSALMFAVAVSVLLAWLTFTLVETPIRAVGVRHVRVKASALLLALIGGFGATTATAGDPRAWAGAHAAKMADLRFPRPRGETCNEWQTVDGQCIRGTTSVALVGDSQAEQIAPALLKAGWWLASTPGCPPFASVDYKQCDGQLVKKVAGLDVKTVVLAFREGYLGELEGLDASLAALKGKRIVILTSVPSLDFDPRDCLARPWFEPAVSDCSVSRAAVSERQRSQRLAIQTVATKYGAEVVDTAALLCGADRCQVDRNGMLVYRDRHHLSVRGGQVIANAVLMASQAP